MSAEPGDRLMTANRAAQSGDLDRAVSLAESGIADDPNQISLLQLLGTLQAKQKNYLSAIETFRRVLSLDANQFEANFWLSVVQRTQGNIAESLEFARRCIEIRPDEAHVHTNLGLSHLSAQALPEAISAFETAIRLNPNVPGNFEQLGRAYQLQGRDHLAFAAFQEADRLKPNSQEVLLGLGQTAYNLNRNEEAAAYAKRVLQNSPGSTTARMLLAGALIEEGLAAEAGNHLQQALQNEPPGASLLATLGMKHQSLGQMEAANISFLSSIEKQPNQGFSYCAYVRNLKIKKSELPLVDKMEELVKTGGVSPRGTSFLHYGLGKAYDDLGEYEQAIGHFDAANVLTRRLKFGNAPYERDRLSNYVDWTIETFTKSFIEEASQFGNPSRLPIFVFGIMRSGTTLIEQIISSHSQTEGAGERTFWLNHGEESIRYGERRIHFERLGILSIRYLDLLRRLFPEAARITDKMPGNYRILGLLACAFPNAKFVHAKRHPIDNCLSIYMTPNRIPNDFANDREAIVHAYQEYERVMRHWGRVLDPGRLLTVPYEQLVSDPEPLVRSMIEFCDLPWETQCLRPQDNARSVVTPSVWQVRQPIYTSSVARWPHYEPWLGAFSKLTT